MPDVRDAGFVVTAEVDGLKEIEARLGGFVVLEKMHDVVELYTYEAQAKAVQNVSGVTVTYSGGTFIVNRVTGNLARKINTSFPTYLSGIVKATADYADAVEAGHAAIDLKKTMKGKVVPLSVPSGTPGSKTIQLQNGAGGTSSYQNVIFRRVGNKGWIIPAARARPFMQAAGEAIEPAFKAAIIEAVESVIFEE